MQQAARQTVRLHRELQLMQSDPPPGVCIWPHSQDCLTRLNAQIQGPDETVYSDGMFILEIQIPERYPFEPPSIRFKTPIYHPNIDNGGRICLDLLNMPPKGSWKPSLNIFTLLTSIRLLLSEPNPDDGLMTEITGEYKHNRASFDLKARQWTEEYAINQQISCFTKETDEGSSHNTLNKRSEEKPVVKSLQAVQRPASKLSISGKRQQQQNSTANEDIPVQEYSKAPEEYAQVQEVPTEIVEDSGSEDDEPPTSRARLSLTQTRRSLALKRKT